MSKKRIIGLMLAFVMMLSVFAMPVEALAAKEQTVITILHTNDVHGNAQEDEKGVDGSTVASLPKLLNKVIKRFYKATEESKLTVIVMNSEYTNIQTFGYGAPTKILKGGGALRLG